ncbi:flagellar hook-basal body complex protein [Tepidamorphus sp. 3E244]|uniref:flagellar hook-basal body complex protein n=1 Tax=Tepidamorphus sp. 3E244 TaxID=3385498 RepID=UPI0038FBFE25
MGIYGAMGIAVGGLKAQSYALEQISSNIANSQTTGYKRVDTSFVDLVTDSPYWQQAGGSVQVYSRGTNTVQGDISNAAVGTYMALNGDGFFVVDQQQGESDGNPIFSGVDAYTRRGDFEIDANGYLVNGSGYFLKGFPVDATTGNISGSLPEAMILSNDFLDANSTTEIKYRANLADYPLTASADPDVPNSELLNAGGFTTNPTTQPTPATVNGSGLANDTNATVTGTVAISADTAANVTGATGLTGTNAASTLVSDGETLTVSIGGTNFTFEFDVSGTNVPSGSNIEVDASGDIDTLLANIQTAIQAQTSGDETAALAGGTVTVDLGSNNTDSITLGGTAAGLGLAGTTEPTNGDVAALDGQTLVIGSDTITFGTGVGEVSNRAELETALAGLTTANVSASINGSGFLTVSGAALATDFAVGGSVDAATAFGVAEQNYSATNTALAGSNAALTLQVGSGAVTNIDLTGINSVEQLATLLNGIDDITYDITDGRVEIVADNGTDTVTLGGDAGALAALGLTAGTTNPTPSTSQYVQANETSGFLESSISGGAITVYDEGGGPANVQLRWAKVASTQNGDANDNWNLFYLSDSTATGTQPMWTNVGEDFTFNASGQLISPATTSITLSNLVVDGSTVGDVTLSYGNGGLTQFADANGNAEVTELRQDGYSAGELVGVSISETGRVVASYDNGRTIDLYQVAIANFNATNRLAKVDGGAFVETQDSGPPIIGTEASIIGSALENSNTDIADEFTKLITTQQAYAAGTRIVTTSDEMLQEVLNMVR